MLKWFNLECWKVSGKISPLAKYASRDIYGWFSTVYIHEISNAREKYTHIECTLHMCLFDVYYVFVTCGNIHFISGFI